MHARVAVETYKDHVPLAIQLEFDNFVGNLWEEVKAMPFEDLHKEVANWVLDPRNTVGRAFAYDRLLMMYWVNLQLVGHSAMV